LDKLAEVFSQATLSKDFPYGLLLVANYACPLVAALLLLLHLDTQKKKVYVWGWVDEQKDW